MWGQCVTCMTSSVTKLHNLIGEDREWDLFGDARTRFISWLVSEQSLQILCLGYWRETLLSSKPPPPLRLLKRYIFFTQISIKPTLLYLRRVPVAVPLCHTSIQEDEGHHPMKPQTIVLKIPSLQALIIQPATCTPSISKNYAPADSRTTLLVLRTCPPSSFPGFLEINLFESFHSTMPRYGQCYTCAGKLAPPRCVIETGALFEIGYYSRKDSNCTSKVSA